MDKNRASPRRPTNAWLVRVRNSKYLLSVSIVISIIFLMFVFDLVKLSIFPDLTPWASDAITIGLIVCITMALLFGLRSKDRSRIEFSTKEMSKRQQIERALITERSFLRMLMDNIPDAIYFKDTQARFMRINRSAATGYGLNDPQQAIGKTDFDFFPLEHAQTAFIDEQKILHTGQAMIAKEECITWPDRPAVWSSTTKLPMRDETGAVIGTFGISRDITEKKHTEIELQKSEEKYRAIIEQSADGISLVDKNGLITEWNTAMENMTTLHKSEVLHRPIWEIEYQLARSDRKAPDFLERMKKMTQATLNSTTALPRTWEVEIERPDGIYLTMSITDFTVRTNDSLLHGSIMRDVTTRKQTEEKLLFLSTHDTLTGLYNRTHFTDVLTQLSKVDPYPISVMMIDIDGMKNVNDMQGHAAGDELIRRTSQVLMRTFRGDDMIARIGGDEFVVLMHRTSSEAAPAAVERLRLKLSEHNGGYEGVVLNLSIGVATATAYEELAQAIATADRQMYKDKELHRTGS
jgi:diguanylate cyclase (GGDEF)-like protein/PAS domain S-box-containing protein